MDVNASVSNNTGAFSFYLIPAISGLAVQDEA